MTKERSKAYPSLDLKAAVNKLEKLVTNLGSGSFSKEEAILGMGYKSVSGASQRALAALRQYGLVQRTKGNYTVSELGSQIVHPPVAGAREQAMLVAALKPAIFKELTEQYSSHGLPELKFLANMLTTARYGIGGKQKDEVAHIYVASMQFAGILQGSSFNPSGHDDEMENENLADAEDDSVKSVSDPVQAHASAPIPLATGNNTVPGTAQGTNHSGPGWSLGVTFKTNQRVSTDIRVKIRALLNQADDIADQLYMLDDQDAEG